jgi:ABC-type lipoprotein export system ATPase subunit
MISILNVTKEFDLGAQDVVAPVKNVTLEIAHGELIIITGRSGSGKTTLLNLTAGLVRPTSGQILIDGVDPISMDEEQLSQFHSSQIGFIFQFPSLLPALSILENVALPATFLHKNSWKQAQTRATALLEQMGLVKRMNVLPKQLSAGEQKRAVIARALMNQPKIVLADEPTSDLDAETESEIMSLLREVNAGGVTFMMVTHNLLLVSYASRAFHMENGALSEIDSESLTSRDLTNATTG